MVEKIPNVKFISFCLKQKRERDCLDRFLLNFKNKSLDVQRGSLVVWNVFMLEIWNTSLPKDVR